MSFASARLTFSGQITLGSPKKRVLSKKELFFSVQRKEARAWHAIAQAMSVKWMLQDEFCEFRPHLFRKDAS
jgi:hypothetical protein